MVDPISAAYFGLKAIQAKRAWDSADAEVAAAAREQGISKAEAWKRVRAEVKRRNDERLEKMLDTADPKGWRAAARAMEKPDADEA